jgi:DNA-directed RNA polymerase specialized sigma24 family protein
LDRHRVLLLKHARASVRAGADKIAAEDVARELELIVAQLTEKGVDFDALTSPDRYFRTLVRHAVGRAKQRHTLIMQVAAGDDLQAVSKDLARLDADLPPKPEADDAEVLAARKKLDAIREALPPRERLVFALLIEDDASESRVAEALGQPPEAISQARAHILEVAGTHGISADADGGGRGGRAGDPPADPGANRESKLRKLAALAGSPSAASDHVAEPLLALMRTGDLSDDIQDALAHVAICADCRARLTEGERERRSVVIMAIEAPGAKPEHMAMAMEASGALLLERGSGRWTAVVDTAHAEDLRGKLEIEGSRVSRLALASPIDVPLEDARPRSLTTSRTNLLLSEPGTGAAEVAAWVQVARKPARDHGLSPGWALFAVIAIALAVVIAYWLATR